jgi:hypothetical protein
MGSDSAMYARAKHHKRSSKASISSWDCNLIVNSNAKYQREADMIIHTLSGPWLWKIQGVSTCKFRFYPINPLMRTSCING